MIIPSTAKKAGQFLTCLQNHLNNSIILSYCLHNALLFIDVVGEVGEVETLCGKTETEFKAADVVVFLYHGVALAICVNEVIKKLGLFSGQSRAELLI